MDTCILCKSSLKDDVQYGDFLKNDHFGVHMFCLYLSSNLAQNGEDDEGFFGFLEADIIKEVNRVSALKCFYCHKKYANIGCCNSKCRRTFHLICGIQHNAQFQFSHDFRSFCNLHATKETRRPSPNKNCLICYDRLCPASNNSDKVNSILTPCCRNGWFHKLCLQKFAKTAGYFFKCPLCNDSKIFREKLPPQGIFIPNQDAAWELEPNAFAELLERPNECAAQICKHKNGRKKCSKNNPFVMCSTCGSTAMHRQCLANGVKAFHCADCTLALEDGDSGQESHNDSECDVDVCHVSDKEDLQIIEMLIETNNKRDSGTQQDSSDDEIIHTSKKCNKIRRISDSTEVNTSNSDTVVTQQQKSRTDSESSIWLPESNSINTRTRTETESSKDTLEDGDFPYVSRRSKKTRIDLLNQEDLPHGSRSTKRIRSDILEDEDLPCNSKSIKSSSDKKINSTTKKPKKTRGTSESIDDNPDNVCNDDNYAIKPTNFRMDLEGSVSPQNLKSLTTRIRSDTESSKDTIIENEKTKAWRLKIGSESKKTDEPKKHKFRKRKSPNIFNDSDSESEEKEVFKIRQSQTSNKENENSLHLSEDELDLNDSETELNLSKLKRLVNGRCQNENKINNDSTRSIVFTDDSDSDDPLENFIEVIEKQKNISCIALRTRRSTNLNKSQGLLKDQSEENKAKLCATGTKQAEKELLFKKKTTSGKFVNIKSPQNSSKKETNADISCIAKRTRRKSICNSSSKNNNNNNNRNIENKRVVYKENPLNTSCIAIRTRRKTICAQTTYSLESLYEQSQIYEKVHESDEISEVSTDDDDDSESTQTDDSELDTDLDGFIVDDGYEEKNSNFEISCIANRTRKRKSLKSRTGKLPEIIEVDSSPEIAEPSKLYNDNVSRRCNRRLSSHFNKEIQLTAPSTSGVKRKQIPTSLWLEKLPQSNYTAFLTPKGSSYSNTR